MNSRATATQPILRQVAVSQSRRSIGYSLVLRTLTSHPSRANPKERSPNLVKNTRTRSEPSVCDSGIRRSCSRWLISGVKEPIRGLSGEETTKSGDIQTTGGYLVVRRPVSDYIGVSAEFVEFRIRWLVVAGDSGNHGHQVLHGETSRPTLSGYVHLEMPSRPVPVLILDTRRHRRQPRRETCVPVVARVRKRIGT
ncbi:hypothetical protein Hjap01_03829 [Haloarcula japonica]